MGVQFQKAVSNSSEVGFDGKLCGIFTTMDTIVVLRLMKQVYELP